jgi:DnaJ-class molecular chaperone
MTTLTAPAPPLEAPAPGELTLGEVLDGAWQELNARGAASCPVCHGGMAPAGGTVRCEDCGAELE